MYSLLIKQARVIDGTGSPERIADVAVEDDRIVNIASHIGTGAQTVIPGHGKILAPGFIDIQNHSDSHWQLFDNPKLESLVTQGYTTILVGNSGASLAPLISQEAMLALQKWHTLQGSNINWRSFAEFAETMQVLRFGCNIGSLVGYSTIRRGLIGDRMSPLSVDELNTLKKVFTDTLGQGAFGLSAGLSYAHELAISDVELYEMAKIVADHNALFSIHLRSEAGQIVDSVREVIAIAQQTNAHVKIAHLKIRNQANWNKLIEAVDELERAWHQGTNIHFDVYPYTSTWQPLYTYVPTWAVEGGRKHLLEMLRNPTQRNKIVTHLNNSETNIKNLIIASTSTKLPVIGKRLSTIAADMGVSSEEALLKLIENGGSEILVFDECLDDAGVQALCNHALGFISTNGSGFNLRDPGKLVHPRSFGTAAKFLRSVIEQKTITLPEAIRKLTSAPAEAMGLKNRGTLKVDYAADMILFDPTTINDTATLQNPYQYSKGIECVWVNGSAVVQHGVPLGTTAGVFLKR